MKRNLIFGLPLVHRQKQHYLMSKMNTKLILKYHSWWLGSWSLCLERLGIAFTKKCVGWSWTILWTNANSKVEFNCNVWNVSTSISLKCNIKVRNQILFHKFVRLNKLWQSVDSYRALLNIVAHIGPMCFEMYVSPGTARSLRWIFIRWHSSTIKNLNTVNWSILDSFTCTPACFNWILRPYEWSYQKSANLFSNAW